MELAPSNSIFLHDDLILYHIGPYFDRLDRNNFRLTNTKYSQLILPQELLNSNYEKACEDNNTNAMIKWRKQGALKPHEEICNLAVDTRQNRKLLAEKLWHRFSVQIIIMPALSYAVIENNLPFASWILKIGKPRHDSPVIYDSLNRSESLKHRAMTSVLLDYIERGKYNERQNERQSQNYRDDWCP